MDTIGEATDTDMPTGIDGEYSYLVANECLLSAVFVVLSSVTVLCAIPYLLQFIYLYLVKNNRKLNKQNKFPISVF